MEGVMVDLWEIQVENCSSCPVEFQDSCPKSQLCHLWNQNLRIFLWNQRFYNFTLQVSIYLIQDKSKQLPMTMLLSTKELRDVIAKSGLHDQQWSQQRWAKKRQISNQRQCPGNKSHLFKIDILDLYHEIKLTATECMPRYNLLVQTKVHHNIAIDAQRTKGY